MFKWIRGFVSGILLAICASTVMFIAFYVWLIESIKEDPKRKRTDNHYYQKYYDKERGED